ncbi:ATPase [Microbulbifer taiwanensis]|uniref:SRPBCC family protein n=1 Tax=Microbulbifer taiwanensis TaxID=986746 RepID=A0ABW1YRH9_9GAMM|nr:ATPase [Microbulbifer taiwanensis]
MSRKFFVTAAVALTATWSSGLAAEVISQSPGEFAIRLEQELEQNSASVYRGLASLPEWWNPAHSYSGSAGNLSMELRAGGCFCERWDQASVEHLRVIYALPEREVRLSGGLGPLQSMPVSGLMQWRIVPQGDKSLLTWEYRVWGSSANKLDAIAEPVNSVLAEQFRALKVYLEKGGEG